MVGGQGASGPAADRLSRALRAAYDRSVDYRKEPQPPLEGEDAGWARELLHDHIGK